MVFFVGSFRRERGHCYIGVQLAARERRRAISTFIAKKIIYLSFRGASDNINTIIKINIISMTRKTGYYEWIAPEVTNNMLHR